MTADRRGVLLALVSLLDLALVGLAYCAANIGVLSAGSLDRIPSLLDVPITIRTVVALAGHLAIWHVVLRACGLYGSYRLSPVRRTLHDLGMVALSAAPASLVLTLLVQPALPAAAFVVAFVTLAFGGLVIERLALRAVSRAFRTRGRNVRQALVVGDDGRVEQTLRVLTEHDALGYRVAGTVAVDASVADAEPVRAAAVAEVEALLDQEVVDEVFVALPSDCGRALLREVVTLCRDQGVVARVVADVVEPLLTTADTIGNQPVFTIAEQPRGLGYLVAKRTIDLVGALVGLVVLMPLFVVVAAAIRRDSPGPVLFRQERVGQNRRRFLALKFRTMVVGAEALQTDLEALNEAQGAVFKIRDDPRVTRVGRWLRRTSIDELPQLVNVLRGEMSLVGPRPLPLRDVARIDARWQKRRFSVKPGITCLWQVTRREPLFEEWARSDIEYIEHSSLALDLEILVRTVPAVLSRNGAH